MQRWQSFAGGEVSVCEVGCCPGPAWGPGAQSRWVQVDQDSLRVPQPEPWRPGKNCLVCPRCPPIARPLRYWCVHPSGAGEGDGDRDTEESHLACKGRGWGSAPGTSSFSEFFLSLLSRPLPISLSGLRPPTATTPSVLSLPLFSHTSRRRCQPRTAASASSSTSSSFSTSSSS